MTQPPITVAVIQIRLALFRCRVWRRAELIEPIEPVERRFCRLESLQALTPSAPVWICAYMSLTTHNADGSAKLRGIKWLVVREVTRGNAVGLVH